MHMTSVRIDFGVRNHRRDRVERSFSRSIRVVCLQSMPDRTSPVGEWSRQKELQGGGGGSFVCVGEPRLSKIGGRAAAAARMQGGSRSQHSLTSVSRRRAVICRLQCAKLLFREKSPLAVSVYSGTLPSSPCPARAPCMRLYHTFFPLMLKLIPSPTCPTPWCSSPWMSTH